MIKKLALGLVLIASTSYAEIGALPGVVQTPWSTKDLTAALGVSQDYSLSVSNNGASAFSWQTIYSAAPGSITVVLEGSIDCTTYTTIESSTSTAGEIRSVFGAWKCVRFNNTAVAGGAGKTLTIKFTYSTGRVTGTTGSGIFIGGTFTSPILLPDGSASAPGLAFASAPAVGFQTTGGRWILTNGAGGRYISLNATGGSIGICSGCNYGFSSTSDATGVLDILLSRDASNTLALRNGGNAGTPVPQTFNVYNFCDGANCATGYERGIVNWSSTANQLTIGTENAGTGLARPLRIKLGSDIYSISSSALTPINNDIQTLGASATQWSAAYISRSIQGSKTKTLTESAATAFVNIAIPDGGHVGGKVQYDLWCADAVPNYVARSCTAQFACINKADAEVCSVQSPACSGDASNGANTFSANTLDYAVGTNSINLRELATCSLAQTVLEIHYRLDLDDPQTVTPQ